MLIKNIKKESFRQKILPYRSANCYSYNRAEMAVDESSDGRTVRLDHHFGLRMNFLIEKPNHN